MFWIHQNVNPCAIQVGKDPKRGSDVSAKCLKIKQLKFFAQILRTATLFLASFGTDGLLSYGTAWLKIKPNKRGTFFFLT